MLSTGLSADFFDERPTNSLITKALYRLGFYKIFPKRSRVHLDKLASLLIAGQFSDVLLINAEIADRPFVQKLIGSKMRVHLYMWDSSQNKPGFLSYLDLLEGKASFDPLDCQRLNLRYVPLFAEDVFAAKNVVNDSVPAKSEIDISFCGTLHSNRSRLLAELERYSRGKNLKLSFMLYYHAKWLLVLKSFLIPSNLRFVNRSSSKSFSKEQISELFRNSRFVLDLPHPQQTGLTARTFEVLRSGSRLISFNPQADTLLPRSLAERIIVVNRIADLEQIDFSGAEALPPLSPENQHFLSIKRFVGDMINLISSPSPV